MSTSGVTVYKHFCAIEGISYGLASVSKEHCVLEGYKNDKHKCCTVETTDNLQFEEECCSEDITLYQLKGDINNVEIQVKTVSILYGFSPSLFQLPIFQEEFVAFEQNPPPFPLTTCQRLSLVQSYLI